ncbi:MAG: holo-ACP synthase [Marmoricola sp.]
MIVGVGVDVADIGRLEASLARTPALRSKLFTPAEAALPVPSLAARFAAKEAVAKALGAPGGLGWHDAEVVREASGRPRLELRGTVLAAASALGATAWHLSLSHDAGLATAFVVLESR